MLECSPTLINTFYHYISTTVIRHTVKSGYKAYMLLTSRAYVYSIVMCYSGITIMYVFECILHLSRYTHSVNVSCAYVN